MSIYDISYDQKAIELLPPDKRTAKQVSWIKAMYGQLKYLRNKTLGDYKTGANYPVWDAMNYYALGDKVIYGQEVYLSLVDANTDVPTFTSSWELYQSNFIGVDNRVKFNHCKLILEYALNERFHTTFRQPDLVSDIYIEKIVTSSSVFIVGADETESSSVYFDRSEEVIINSYTFGFSYNFTINIPIAVYNDLASNDFTRERIIRSFVDQYNTIGLFYNIATY